jgi:trigger factor
MQVSLTATGGLERRLEVAVPAATVAAEVDQRLKKLSRTARLKGFRPGKAPLAVVQRQFGGQVHAEVVTDLLRSSFAEAVSRENLTPATGPRIEPLALDAGHDLRYVATFEILPEVRLADISALAVERPTADVTDADVDAMLESMRRQRPVFSPVDRPAEEGDRVVVDFDGRVGGEPFQGGEGRDAAFNLGEGRVLPAFETAVRGARAGETRAVETTFPADHANEELAGRAAVFTLTLKKVEARSLPDIDDAFAVSFGVHEGGVEALRAEVRRSMERELIEAIRAQVKAAVMEGLLRDNPIEVPRGLVDETIEEMRVEMGRRLGAKDMSQLPAAEPFEQPARRRVALALIVGELMKQAALKVDRARVQMRLEEIASVYPNADEVRRSYLQNAEAMREVESAVLEDQLVDWILGRARVTTRESSFKDITRFGQNEAA